MSDSDHRVAIGKLGRPHGIRGEIRLFPFNPNSHTVTDGLHASVSREDVPDLDVTVEKARYTDKFIIVKFEEFDDRGDVDELKHGHLKVSYDDLPELEDDRFYYVELEGAPVYVAPEEDGELADDAEPMGVVDRFFETGANDVMVVNTDDGDDLFVPLVEHAVVLLDFQEGRVILQPLEI